MLGIWSPTLLFLLGFILSVNKSCNAGDSFLTSNLELSIALYMSLTMSNTLIPLGSINLGSIVLNPNTVLGTLVASTISPKGICSSLCIMAVLGICLYIFCKSNSSFLTLFK